MPEEPRRRGRPRRAEPAEPAGYRITAAQRRQLYIAMGFTDQRSLQAIIDTVNSTGATPDDLIAILQALDQVGAIEGELTVI